MQRTLLRATAQKRVPRCSCFSHLPQIRHYAAPAAPPLSGDRLLTAARKLLSSAEAADDEGNGGIEAAKRMRELEPLRRALVDVEEGEEVSLVGCLVARGSGRSR